MVSLASQMVSNEAQYMLAMKTQQALSTSPGASQTGKEESAAEGKCDQFKPRDEQKPMEMDLEWHRNRKATSAQ